MASTARIGAAVEGREVMETRSRRCALQILLPNGAAAYLVWCRYCEVWHEHGPAEGHRIAHCQSATQYTATGYNLALAGKWTEAFK
jgi:hypothetical protein